jgi:hypothetical protein
MVLGAKKPDKIHLFYPGLSVSRRRWKLEGAYGGSQKEARAMKNVEMTLEGTILTIKIDLSKEFGLSASEKNIIIASTEGNVTVPNRDEKIGLNVYRKK